MTPATTVALVKAFKNCCNIMGWNQGIQSVTKFTNQNNIVINIVKNYGQINKANLQAGCEWRRQGSAMSSTEKSHDGPMP